MYQGWCYICQKLSSFWNNINLQNCLLHTDVKPKNYFTSLPWEKFEKMGLHKFKDYGWDHIPSNNLQITLPLHQKLYWKWADHKNWVSRGDGSVHLYLMNNLPDFTPWRFTSILETSAPLLPWRRNVKVSTHLPRNLCMWFNSRKRLKQ